MKLKDFTTRNSFFPATEVAVIILLSIVPLFVSFPYRVNIFLSWEGAYRISEGQLPFRDFGTPLGGMYWVLPGLFFKLFGAQLISLVKAQVFINIMSGLAFRSIMKSMGLQGGIKFAAVLLYCISFSFFNFWPWYNHTVIVYEFIAIAFLFKGIQGTTKRSSYLYLIVAAFFTVCSFLTKQDAGAMAFLLACLFLFYAAIRDKKWLPFVVYAGSFVVLLSLFILPFIKYDFGYWFNYGQAPHSARISLLEILDEFLAASQWVKFYLFTIIILLFIRFKNLNDLWMNKQTMLFFLLTVGMLGQAAVFQVTSYTPPDNNIFFHAFAVAFILYQLYELFPVATSGKWFVLAMTAGMLLWWSGVFWKYIQRYAEKNSSKEAIQLSPTGENIVTKKTYMIPPVDTLETGMGQWVYCGLKSFEKIAMPPSTADGIKRLMNSDLVKNNHSLKVLNMTELTPLAVEIPFALEKGPHYPLWNHLGVAMFNKQAEMFEDRIAGREYDLVLFEYIPTLNNFYPFRVRDSLRQHYQQIDSFLAPRRGDTKGFIEVYVRPATEAVQ